MNSPPILGFLFGWIESDVHWGLTGLAFDPWPLLKKSRGTHLHRPFALSPFRGDRRIRFDGPPAHPRRSEEQLQPVLLQLLTLVLGKMGRQKAKSVSPQVNIRFNPTTQIGNLKWVVNSPTNQNGIPLVLTHSQIERGKKRGSRGRVGPSES